MRSIVAPGATLGIIGGGHGAAQLARAGAALGYGTRTVDPQRCASLGEAMQEVRALAEQSALVTVASEDVRDELLEGIAARTLLRPGRRVLALAQHRVREREWLQRARFNVLPWRAAATRDELLAAVRELQAPCYVKPQVRRRAELRPLLVTSEQEAASAWNAMRGLPLVVEAYGHVEAELTVLAVRALSGQVRCYPPARLLREQGRVALSTFPAVVTPQLATRVQRLAEYVARKLEVEGLLAVELFLLADGRLVVNELAPAPHAAYDATEVACGASQYEQQLRCVTGLPLAATDVLAPAATVSIGRSTTPRAADRVSRALRIPGVRAHLYPPDAERANAIGHLSATGATTDEALTRLLLAEAARDPRRARRLALQRERLDWGPGARG
ncbi:MAG TPA: ATP-grasp domain-containing protein [Gemmatimonadaceae bacterium]|nr:ATP-grasp domain-containing protein [Gemmatimonadaceae bacterium]